MMARDVTHLRHPTRRRPFGGDPHGLALTYCGRTSFRTDVASFLPDAIALVTCSACLSKWRRDLEKHSGAVHPDLCVALAVAGAVLTVLVLVARS